MLFTSNIFLYAFLPTTLGLFYILARVPNAKRLIIPFLILASFVFYGYSNQANIPLFVASIVMNFVAGYCIEKYRHKTAFFWAGVILNLGILFYFKYTNFFLENLYGLQGKDFEPLHIILPLAISFHTFQQIAYLSDVKRGLVKRVSLKEYILFVSFFPQLIIGPIVHHKEMIPQFKDANLGRFSWDNFKCGFFYIIAGLSKKIFLSDYCAQIVNTIHGDMANGVPVTFLDAWASALAFSFQIYFDFSGYTDMAIGIALLFGIVLPINFNSPYKSVNVADFWRRWHITLSRWLRDYLYIPLGGNEKGFSRSLSNALIVFLIGGLWHGAAWTFVLWGLVQGIGVALSRILERINIPVPTLLAIAVTFIFTTCSWVLFRSVSVDQAFDLYSIMFGGQGIELQAREIVISNLPIMAICALITFLLPNTHNLVPRFAAVLKRLPVLTTVAVMLVVWLSMAAFDLDSSAEFIYFDF